jgi:hypothetical protein
MAAVTWIAPLAALTSGVTTGILLTQTFPALLEGKLLKRTNGEVLGAGMINAVGICTLGKVVAISLAIIFLPGMIWYCTMLATLAAGNALITAREIPEAVNAASLGANTVNRLFLSDTAVIKPAFVTAARSIEKLALVFNTSPIVLPACTGPGKGVASGTFLLQDVNPMIPRTNKGMMDFSIFIVLFIIVYLAQHAFYRLENIIAK